MQVIADCARQESNNVLLMHQRLTAVVRRNSVQVHVTHSAGDNCHHSFIITVVGALFPPLALSNLIYFSDPIQAFWEPQCKTLYSRRTTHWLSKNSDQTFLEAKFGTFITECLPLLSFSHQRRPRCFGRTLYCTVLLIWCNMSALPYHIDLCAYKLNLTVSVLPCRACQTVIIDACVC